MAYTAVNPHACCNWPRPEDAHAAARSPPHPHASPHLTNNDRLRWKTDGRPPANGPPTATPQQRRHSPSTPARGPPRPPTPRPSPQPTPPPSQSQGQVPITEQNLSLVLGPLNSLLWYVPSSRYIWSSAPILFLQEQTKDIIISNTFSKVSDLVYFSYKVTTEATFEKTRATTSFACPVARSLVLGLLFVVWSQIVHTACIHV